MPTPALTREFERLHNRPYRKADFSVPPGPNATYLPPDDLTPPKPMPLFRMSKHDFRALLVIGFFGVVGLAVSILTRL